MPEDTTETFEIPEKSAFIFDAKHTGDMNFQVYLLNINDNTKEILLNTVGDFDGRAVTAVSPGKYVFNVTYGQDYEIIPVDIVEDDFVEPPVEIQGEDFDVIPTQLNGAVRFSIEAQTDQNVQVMLHDVMGETVDVVFNELGAGEYVTTLMQEGTGLFYVKTEDEWDLSMEDLWQSTDTTSGLAQLCWALVYECYHIHLVH